MIESETRVFGVSDVKEKILGIWGTTRRQTCCAERKNLMEIVLPELLLREGTTDINIDK